MYQSKYFKPIEFFYSRTAHENSIFNCPTSWQIFENLSVLATHLDKIREQYGNYILINSAYRAEKLNRLLTGSSSTSYHLCGRAADITGSNFQLLRDTVFNYCGFHYINGIKHYEDDNFEVIVYNDRKFIHFAYKTI